MKVVLDISPDETGGWQTTRGTISGDPETLSGAFANDREAVLVHDATGFAMNLTILDVSADGIAHVTIDVSKPSPV